MVEIDWHLVDRYLAGECTKDEEALVEQWFAESPAFARRLAVNWVALHSRDTASPTRREALWASFQAAAATATTVRDVHRRPLRGLPRRHTSWVRSPGIRAAAAVILAVGASMVAYVELRSPSSSVQPSAADIRTVTTVRGQRLVLRLPDSTQVVLAPASTLRYASTYGAPSRAVELVGQAAFTVVHDERRPFIVRAGKLVAEDLGTEFIVRAYPEQDNPEVFVREGIVAVRDTAAAAEYAAQVHAGQKGRLSATGVPIVEPTDAAMDFAWTNGRLVFRRTPLRDALPLIERWYDIDIQVAPSTLSSEWLTGTFRDGESLSSVLGLIAKALDLKVAATGPRTYRLYAR